MIILTNCLSDRVDEGCLKIANSLIKRIRQARPDTYLISYGDPAQPADKYLRLNKFLLNWELLTLLYRRKEPLLYVPAVAKGHTMAARVFLLSLFARRGMRVIQVMQYETRGLPRLLLKLSGAKVLTFSHSTWEYYHSITGGNAEQLKAGVNTDTFRPVSEEDKKALRAKYGLPEDRIVVLHVGHLRSGRNVKELLKLDDRFWGVLVASTYEAAEQEPELKAQLLTKENITVIDRYLPDIREVYQLADVYLFPVEIPHNCIDIPLSAMEAAACGVPVVTTAYGELARLLDRDGFYEIRSFEADALNSLLARAAAEKHSPRAGVMEYDWNTAVNYLLDDMKI